jgi:plastocyanin domain-containing protein
MDRLRSPTRRAHGYFRLREEALAWSEHAVDTDAMPLRILLLCALVLACRSSQQSAQPPTSDGTPVYAVSVTSRGFDPVRVEVQPDRDVVLRFTRKVKETCADSVVVQGDPVKHMLPLDKPIDVRLRAPKSGEVRFACGMDMYRGAVVVAGG